MKVIVPVIGGIALAYTGVIPGALGACALDAGCEDYRAIPAGWAVALVVAAAVVCAAGLIVMFRGLWRLK